MNFFFFSEFKCPVEILTGKLWPGYGSFAEATVQQFKVDQLNANISYYVFIDLSASTICFYIMEFLPNWFKCLTYLVIVLGRPNHRTRC